MTKAAPLTPPPPHYDEWLSYLFDRDVTDPAWYHSADTLPFPGESTEIAKLFIHTMRNCGHDLLRFSNDQVTAGLQHVINPSCGNIVFQLMQKPLPKDAREEVILSLSVLYSNCFSPRCVPVLSHQDEPGGNSLNGLCYMFWDVTPLLSGRPRAVLQVLKLALKDPNLACQESALHGFGHLARTSRDGDQVADIITSYLRAQRPGAALQVYAERAARGAIP